MVQCVHATTSIDIQSTVLICLLMLHLHLSQISEKKPGVKRSGKVRVMARG